MSVDKEARRLARHSIKRFVSGEITNDEFIDKYPLGSKDRAIKAIYDRFWAFYDDNYTHYLNASEFQKDATSVEVVSRCVSFLDTDLEYRWRDLGLHSRFNLVLWLHRRGVFSGVLADKLALGDYSAWPFFRSAEIPPSAGRKPGDENPGKPGNMGTGSCEEIGRE